MRDWATSLVKGPVAGYMGLLARAPRTTKAATAAVIALFGDALAQYHGASPSGYSFQRSAAFALWAAAVCVPQHSWYLFLRHEIPLKAVLMDQLIWAPPFTAGFLFWAAAATSDGRTWVGAFSRGKENVLATFLPVILTNWAVWGPVQLVNFYFVPLPLRILFGNFVGLGWSGALSYLSFPTAANELR
jgi:hypothetical protein